MLDNEGGTFAGEMIEEDVYLHGKELCLIVFYGEKCEVFLLVEVL